MKIRKVVLKLSSVFLLLLISFPSLAQVNGLYVEFFGSYILGNSTLEGNVISYAQNHQFNYLLLYQVDGFVIPRDAPKLTNADPLTSSQQALSAFIFTAKTAIPGLKIGVAGGALETYPSLNQSVFFDNVDWFNGKVGNAMHSIDVMNLEYEYWGHSAQVVVDDDFTNHYLPQLTNMHDIKINTNNTPLMVEVYLGRINNGQVETEQVQADAIDPLADRILMTAYVPNEFMQNRLQSPGYVNLQFEFDWGLGKRYQTFANNSTPTTIITLLSSESSDLNVVLSSHPNYYGDYLWFYGILNSGTVCPSSTASLLNYPYLDLTYESSIDAFQYNPFYDWDFTYRSNVDPYNDGTYPGRGFPCADPLPTMYKCTDIANVTNGNTIGGQIWFRYGLMPLKDNDAPFYLDIGADQTVGLLENFTLNPTEHLTDISAAAGISINVVKYNWYKNGEHMATTYPGASQAYVGLSSNVNLTVDVYTCEIVTDVLSPYVVANRIRDDVKITSDINNAITSPYVSIQTTPESCFGNDGSATLIPHNYTSGPTYYWIGNGSMTATATGLAAGGYTVNVNSQPVYVSVPSFNNPPHPIINSLNSFACDKHLTVGSHFSTYQWFINGAAINAATSANYTASQNGVYTVVVTNSYGCSGTSQQYNLNSSLSAAITGVTSTCGSTIYTVPDAGEGASYNWQIPSGASFILLNKFYANISWGNAQYSGGTISCTVTNACGNSATGSIDVLGCCNTPNFTQKNNETATASILYCGQHININGIYTIPNGKIITFDKCDIQFSNDARIEVQPGGTLYVQTTGACNGNGITRSHLYACGTGWTGIHLDGSTAVANIDNALIENAANAVYTNNGGEFHITNSDFDMNTESIAPSNANYGICTVTGNTFNCSTCNGNTGDIIHIDAIHADQLTISGNHFKNCAIGIKSSDRSYTYVQGNTFLNVDRAGVWAENDGYIEVTLYNIFTNCNGGVVASNSVATTVDGNYFSGGAVAVVTQSCMNRKINILNNEIVNPSWIGISGFFNYPSLQHYVNNTISFNPNQMVYGIAVWESNLIQPGLNNVTDINGNHVFDAAVGINIGNDYKTTVTENDIHFINSNTHKVTGILAENSHYPQIIGNIVRDESALKEAQFGIVVELGGGALLCSNNVYAMAQGIVFGGNMLGTNVQVVLNTMEKCDIGFVLRNGGDIGSQGGQGVYYYNKWINNGYDSYSFGSNISNTSHFPVFVSANSIPYIISTHSNDGQNGANDILSPVSSAASQYTATCDGNIKDPTDDAKKVINDELTYSVDSDATQWIGKNAVLDALKYKDDLNSSDADIQSFEASADNDAMGELRSLKEDFATAFTDTTIAGGDSTIIAQVKVSNQQVSDQKVIETYLKTVNDIYLNTAAINKKEFNAQQTSSLQFIAQLCPYEGGPAVYTAQYLLFYKEGVFYTYNNCNDYSPMRSVHSGINGSRFIVYPNPTDSKVTLTYILNDENASYYVKIFDNIGRVLAVQKLNSNSVSTEIDLSNFATGLYHYEIFENVNQINAGKISVVR